MYDQASDTFVNTPKSFGKSITVADLPAGIAKFFPTKNDEGAGGVSPELLSPVIRGVAEEVKKIQAVLADLEMRMVGGSLLIVWEGDETALKASLDHAAAEIDVDEGDSDDSEAKKAAIGPPLLVKLIDFAHTRLAPGEGPDQGVLLGIDTVLNLLEGRAKQVAA